MGMALFSVLSIENLRALGEPPQDILTRSGRTLLRSCEVMACLSSWVRDAELHDLKN